MKIRWKRSVIEDKEEKEESDKLYTEFIETSDPLHKKCTFCGEWYNASWQFDRSCDSCFHLEVDKIRLKARNRKTLV